MPGFEVEKRSPLVAGTLNAVIPGLGHLYVGRAKRALSLLIGVEAFCIALGQFNIFGTYAGFLLFYTLHSVVLYLIFDAGRIAKKSPQPAPKPYMSNFHYIAYAIAFLVLSTVLGMYRADIYGFDLFAMPDDAMAPTMVKDDVVLVDTRIYRSSKPKAGDTVLISDTTGQTVRRVMSVDFETVEIAADDTNTLQGSGTINQSTIIGRVSQVLFSPRIFNMLVLRF